MAAGTATPMAGTAVAHLGEFAARVAEAPDERLLADARMRLLDVVGISVAALGTGPADVARSLAGQWGGAAVAGAQQAGFPLPQPACRRFAARTSCPNVRRL